MQRTKCSGQGEREAAVAQLTRTEENEDLWKGERERQRDPLSKVIMCPGEEKRGKIFRWCDASCFLGYLEFKV